MYKVIFNKDEKKLKTDFFRIIRCLASLSLRDTQEIFDYIQESKENKILLIAGVSLEKANDLKAQMSELGYSVSIEETDIMQPVLIFPKANKIFSFSRIFGINEKK